MAYRIPLYFCIALLCWANYALLAQTTPKSSSSMDSRVDKLVAPYFESGQMMGATVGVIRDGEVWIKGYGSLSRNQPEVTPDGNTVFEIGSISKVFTGLLLADSVTRQKVRLDQTLGELVTDLKNKNEKAAAIRLLDLTHHKSGLPRMPNNANPQSAEFPFENYDWKLMKEFLESVALNGKPGEKYTYSNYAVGLLGTVLARNEDRTYENMIQQQIFKPLKMESSSTVVSENLKPRLAPPHLASLETTSEFSFNAMKGAGGIRSTVNDMIKFMQA
ncbi:MAG: serine hydrolase domain-containing protein, partial [Planctomycetota bacterium]